MKRSINFLSSLVLFSITLAHADSGSELWTSYTSKRTKPMNPSISANMLGLFQRGTDLSNDRNDDNRNGFRIQEAELQVSSDVDPYLRASALLSVHQEAGEWGIEPEEIYLETISLSNITLRAGKAKMALGKHNQLHTHAYPFIDAPLIQSKLLGEEGLNDVGVSGSILVPFSWYSEVIGQIFDSANGTLVGTTRSNGMGALLRVRNLWDLNDSLTFEWGVSGTKAKNSIGRYASVIESDLTFKWRPTEQGKYKAFIWSTEFMSGKRPGSTDSTTALDNSHLSGVASWVQYQMNERWWIQARIEQFGILYRSQGITGERKQSALLGFFPSEFSGFRGQYDHISNFGADRDEHRFSVQYNISIGAHPAHAY